MKREQTLFVATTEDGEMWHLLDEFACHLADDPDVEFEIAQWTAGYIMQNNSLWKDEDEDWYQDPLTLWNNLQNQVAWQKRRGITNLEAARQLAIQDANEMRAVRDKLKNSRP